MDFAKTYKTEAEIKIDDTVVRVSNPYKNPGYQSAIAKKAKDGQISESDSLDLIADHVILGWDNLQFKGKPIKFSKKSARKLLDVSDVFRDFIGQAFNRQIFESDVDFDFEDLGN